MNTQSWISSNVIQELQPCHCFISVHRSISTKISTQKVRQEEDSLHIIMEFCEKGAPGEWWREFHSGFWFEVWWLLWLHHLFQKGFIGTSTFKSGLEIQLGIMLSLFWLFCWWSSFLSRWFYLIFLYRVHSHKSLEPFVDIVKVHQCHRSFDLTKIRRFTNYLTNQNWTVESEKWESNLAKVKK